MRGDIQERLLSNGRARSDPESGSAQSPFLRSRSSRCRWSRRPCAPARAAYPESPLYGVCMTAARSFPGPLHRSDHVSHVVAQQEAVGIQNDDVLRVRRLRAARIACGSAPRPDRRALSPLELDLICKPSPHDREVRIEVGGFRRRVREIGKSLALEQRDVRLETRRQKHRTPLRSARRSCGVLTQFCRSPAVGLGRLAQDSADKELAGMVVGAAERTVLDLDGNIARAMPSLIVQARRPFPPPASTSAGDVAASRNSAATAAKRSVIGASMSLIRSTCARG